MRVNVAGRMPSTLPADDDHPYRTGPWRPQQTEWDADDLDVVGTIPADLDGAYLRNTENPVHDSLGHYHPFDGDGMLHMIRFADGRATYRNRFVRTAGLAAENEAGEPLWAGLAEPPARSKRDGWGARTRMKDASSTDVVVHAGLAKTSFYQCGDLYRLDPLTLETLGRESWDGRFPAEGVSAHTKVDEHTGEMLFFNYSTRAPYLHYGVVDAADRLVHYTPIPLPGPRLPHDMAFTERFAIVNDCPLFWDAELMAKGLYAVRFHPDLPTRFGILPRRGSAADVRWFEAAPTYVLHWINAYEDGDEVVLDGFFQHCPQPSLRGANTYYERISRFLSLDQMQTRAHRWRFDLATGATREEDLSDRIMEFGTINGRHGGRPYRYAYNMTAPPGRFLFDGLVKHDLRTGREEHFAFGDGVFASETPMAPRRGSAAEDDGYLVTFVIDMNADRSECWIFAAQDVQAGPIARVRLPERISSGTHSCWAPAATLRRA
ncbi:MAG: carotenoid oxygenase family protein [Candidatus Binatia bacterium]